MSNFPIPFCYFGVDPNDTVLTPHGYNGQPGWFRVPTQWHCQSQPSGEVKVSPNSDFSPPVYFAKMDLDGTLVVQDKMATQESDRG